MDNTYTCKGHGGDMMGNMKVFFFQTRHIWFLQFLMFPGGLGVDL